MRTIRIILTNGQEINLIDTKQSLQDILKTIAEEKTNFILIEGHSAINKNHISMVVDMSRVNK